MYPSIKKFNATIRSMGGEMEAAKLQRIVVQLPNLAELGFSPNKNLTKDNLVDLFQLNSNLVKIFLVVSPETFTDDFKNEISDEFDVHDNRIKEGYGIVTVERKELN